MANSHGDTINIPRLQKNPERDTDCFTRILHGFVPFTYHLHRTSRYSIVALGLLFLTDLIYPFSLFYEQILSMRNLRSCEISGKLLATTYMPCIIVWSSRGMELASVIIFVPCEEFIRGVIFFLCK